MASGYALPNATHFAHSHSHSYSGVSSSPAPTASHVHSSSNGHLVKKAASNNALFTHSEASQETTPTPSPFEEYASHNHFPALKPSSSASHDHDRLHPHTHCHSQPSMKGRLRGESDLGQPFESTDKLRASTDVRTPSGSASWLSTPELLTSLLVPLPYIFASAAYSSTQGASPATFSPLSAHAKTQEQILSQRTVGPDRGLGGLSGLIESCTLTSGTLLSVALLAKLGAMDRSLDRQKNTHSVSVQLKALQSFSSVQSMVTRTFSLILPFYAALQLGGVRIGLVLLVAIAANLICRNAPRGPLMAHWKHLLPSSVASATVILLMCVCDGTGLTVNIPSANFNLGYLALAISIILLDLPLPSSGVRLASGSNVKGSPSSTPRRPWSRHLTGGGTLGEVSPLAGSPDEVNLTLAAGIILALSTVLFSALLSAAPAVSSWAIFLSTMAVGSMVIAIFFAQPSSLRNDRKLGLGLVCMITASCSFLFAPSLWPGMICNGALSALSFFGVLYDTKGVAFSQLVHRHDHDHDNHHDHHHPHSHSHAHGKHHHVHESNHHQAAEGGPSAFTQLLLRYCTPGSLLHGVLSDKDSRRITYFTALNFGFMFVQGVYGCWSGSLGLLSDTVHMLFDCIGLLVGLGAAVASKLEVTPEKPYGWGKLNTLAGFGNGVFLMLVSVEFVWEAIEGIMEHQELRHVQELLVVSVLGFIVNLVGLFAFGHAHAGHDHGHSHGHSHSHGHAHAGHDHGHSHGHSHPHGHDHKLSHVHSQSHSHSHSHDHDHDHHGHSHPPAPAHDHHHHNDNMHGIFLHVAADAGGSLAVISSTALTLWRPWYLWDPLATIIIAILIFAAAVPLVISSGQKLLLVIPDGELEYSLKTALQELSEIRGVVGYAVPKFWLDDKDAASAGGGHHDHHDHPPALAGGKQKVLGVIHVIAAPTADLEDVRERVEGFLREWNMDIVIHVEREAEGNCWCGGAGIQLKSG